VGQGGEWSVVSNGDVSLAVRDFGGSGEPILLLHGLAGHGREWESVVDHLTESHRVFALDLRGHGRSERLPVDVSPASFCADVVVVVEALGLRAVHLVGQSFGGHIGFLVAATAPTVVSSLVVIEADPDPTAPAVVDRVRGWLASWPVPLPSEEAAFSYFSATSSPGTWVAGLEARDGGYWPRFDASVLVAALQGLTGRRGGTTGGGSQRPRWWSGAPEAS